ncbi:MAG TPA: peroxidase family protein, partial [Solirubrobacterales bacterium]|nr:peroxidase family protein [Solirubrobacterales bacterium]
FLPTIGVRLRPYSGYRPNVNPTLGNEFAAVGYRAHSMIHGEFELTGDASEYTPSDLASLEQMGVGVEQSGSEIEFEVPLNVAFFNPDLVPDLGLDSILAGLSSEAQYNNDEQIDNALRSVLFQVPGPNAPDPAACFEDPSAAGCYQGVVDLGAIDVQRGRDHGIPSYNRLRRAFGLRPARTFKEITGEPTDRFPSDPEIGGNPMYDPDILDFTALFDAAGSPIPFGSEEAEEDAIVGIRRTTLAARLRAIYGSPNKVDPFVGMVAEPHVRGTEFGQLQLAMWKQQFEALRDGDRFFYAGDPALDQIAHRYGITYRHRLSELIALNTDIPAVALPQNVFLAP